MKKILAFAAVAALSVAGVAPADAAVITSLYNTGVTNSGTATTGNGADLHWTLADGPAYTGGTNGVYPIGPWVSDTSTVRWITPTQDASDNNAVAPFTYSTTFSLAGFDFTTASLSGQFAADDYVSSILLNSTVLATNVGGYSYLTSFSAGSSAFVAGTNTLSFVSVNSGGGPAGLQVQVSGMANAVPEPGAWALMIVGFGGIGAALRRRRGQVALTA